MTPEQAPRIVEAVIALLVAITMVISTVNNLLMQNLHKKVDCINDPSECSPQTGSANDNQVPK